MPSDDRFDELKNLGAEFDGEYGEDGETQHPASEDRQKKMRPVHFGDAGGKDEEFEWEAGGHHAGNDEREVAIFLGQAMDAIKPCPSDFLHDEGVAARVADEVGNEASEGRTRGSQDDVEQRAS